MVERVHKKPVFYYFLHVNKKSYFLNTEKTIDYCKIITKKSIKIVQEKYKAKVVSVVTD